MQEETGDWTKPFSVKQLTEKAERHIFQILPMQSQSSEDSLSQLRLHVGRFSRQSLPISLNSPRDKEIRKLPPILRYLSQKYMKQV